MNNRSKLARVSTKLPKKSVSINNLAVAVEEERLKRKEKAGSKNFHNSALSGLYISHIQSTLRGRG